MLVTLSTARSPLWNVSINTQALLGAIVYALSATRHPSVEMSFQGGTCIRRARLNNLLGLSLHPVATQKVIQLRDSLLRS